MTLREWICSNRQSIVIWWKRVWPNCHITFIEIMLIGYSYNSLCNVYGVVEMDERNANGFLIIYDRRTCPPTLITVFDTLANT